MESQGQDLFDIGKISSEIQSLLPEIAWEMETGSGFISMTCPNSQNPRFPLVISVYETQGIFLDLSQCGGILECHADIPEVAKLVKDILSDNIIVAIAYPDEDKFERQILYSMMRSFYLGDASVDDEDDEAEFRKFIHTVSRPRRFLERWNVFAFHGVIEISNWSGSVYHKIYRK